ncbi:MAG: endonuclease V [Candidatus Latescibacterota bacterium]|nr:MAG: endonuclease V [Candidatus Latescibacterota bacterium]
MKLPQEPHAWDLSPEQARQLQRDLASRVECTWRGRSVRLVAGIDCTVSRDGAACIAAVVSYELHRGQAVEQRVAHAPLRFPYVPGLLSFRETPAVLAALRKLRQVPDVVLCDAHGLAHPRRFGLACHLGVITGLATVGCAKSRLVGRHTEPGARKGCRRALMDRGERVGTVLRTRGGVKPLYVSIGHGIDLPLAERIVLACSVRYRLPEPQRLAHQLAARARARRSTDCI